MTARVEAFFDSVPELQQYFGAAAKRAPAPDALLSQIAEGFDLLANVPKDRAQRTRAQQDQSIDARMQVATATHRAARQNILTAELREMDRIITSHLKPA